MPEHLKFEGLTLFRGVNQDRLDTVLVTVPHYNYPAEDPHTGFTCIALRDTASVIRNQWGGRIENFKVLDLL